MKRYLPAPFVYLLLECSKGFLFAFAFTVTAVYCIGVAKLDAFQLLLLGTACELTVFLFEIPTGVVADTVSRRTSVIAGHIVAGAAFLVEGSFATFMPILLAHALWGFGSTFVSGADVAWITDEVGEEKARSLYLRGARLAVIGGAVGIGASVALSYYSLRLPILLAGGIYIALGLFLLATMPETGFRPRPRDRTASMGASMANVFWDGLRAVRTRRALSTIFAVALFLGMSSEGFDRLWEYQLIKSVGLPELGMHHLVACLGTIAGIGLLLSAVTNGVVSRRINLGTHRGAVVPLALINGFMVVALTVFAQAEKLPLALVAYWSVSVLRALNAPIYTAWLNQELDPPSRATVNSMSNQCNAIGQIAGGPLLGLVASALSVRAALTVAGIAHASSVLLFARALRAPPNEPVDAPPVGDT